MADVRTIAGVELVKVGRWEASTGVFRVTKADLVSAVDAHRAGIKRKPVLKIGHSDADDRVPALGYVDNLRVSADGNTLLGDFVNVPARLAELIPLAYPDRSIEGFTDYYHQSTGTTWPLVIDAVALGAVAPGVSDLTSLQAVGDLYGVAARVSTPTDTLVYLRCPNPTRNRAVAVAAARRRRAQRIPTQQKG